MQYKNAMDRIKRLNCASASPQLIDLPDLEEEGREIALSSTSLLPQVEIGGMSVEGRTATIRYNNTKSCVEDHCGKERSPLTNQVITAMKVIVPIKIGLLLLKILLLLYFIDDLQRLLDVWYMPLLGVIAACLANCVPIGGGIVYVPALALLGSEMKLGVSFSVATMTVGNGIFGYLNWQRKNPSLLVWEAIPFTVVPSSIGTLVSLLVNSQPEAVVKQYFALFCFLLAVFVFFSVHKGGIAKVVHQYKWTSTVISGKDKGSKPIITCEDDSKCDSEQPVTEGKEDLSFEINSPCKESEEAASGGRFAVSSWTEWFPLTCVSFLAGLVLVPNIAIGPSLTTFLGLVLMGFQEKEAMVTGIVVGGWASIVPFLLHMCYFRDVPWDLWLMVLPGVALGSWLAPQVQTFIGIDNSLIAFGTFLLCTFALFMTH